MNLKTTAADAPESNEPEQKKEEEKATRTVKIGDNEFPLEERVVETKEGEFGFYFLVVDSAEKWAAAEIFHGTHYLGGVSASQKMKVPMNGVSLKDWEEVERIHSLPKSPSPEDAEDPNIQDEYNRKQSEALAARRVMLFEISTGKKIPGETTEEKVAWLLKRNPRDIESMFTDLQNRICNLAEGHLVANYTEKTLEQQASSVKELTSFEDWSVASDATHYFRMHRQTEDYIVEFPLKGMSSEDRMAIEAACKDPKPPNIPARDPVTKRFDPSRIVPNYEDPAWLGRVRAVNQKRIAMYLDKCLVFKIPGDNEKERYDWASERVVGDIVRLRDFIEREITGMGQHYDFF